MTRSGSMDAVVLRTPFTELFGVRHPIALAPMGGTAGGALAAAVSEGGGLGLLGAGSGDPEWMERELAIMRERTHRPWGVGFLSWAASPPAVEQALEHRPNAVMLSFGDPSALAEPVLEAGVPLIVQVTDVHEAEQALAVGASVLVAQGAEAGGHGGRRSTLPFVPVVVDMAGDVPVLAAGGIADGRGLGAVLVLGAAGALIGTRFQASHESLADRAIVEAIVDSSGGDTERSRLLDIARGSSWPERYTARTLRNAVTEEWGGREDDLLSDERARADYRVRAELGDLTAAPMWAGESTDLVSGVGRAADLVATIAAEAEAALARIALP